MTAEATPSQPQPPSDPEPESAVPEGPIADLAVTALRDICPFLLAADGDWRSAEATGDHRCTAVFPPAVLTTEKQRRLCLTATHESCATFVAALAAREPAIEAVPAGSRPMPRTTPVVMERGRFTRPVLSMRPDRTAAQAALVILLGVAFAGVLFTRLGSAPSGVAGPSTSPAVSAPAVTAAPSEAAVVPSATPVDASPSPSVTLPPTQDSPAPSGSATTYTVQRGDTLSGIAARYGTTWKVIAQLNHIKNPSALRVGTVLQLP